jgi:PAS domain S-box-containing protein
MLCEKLRSERNGDMADMLIEIIDTAQDAIITIDEDQEIILYNLAAERCFGYSPEDVLGKSLIILLPESVRPMHHQHVKRFDKEYDGPRECGNNRKEMHGLRKSGEEFPCEVSISKSLFKGTKYFTAIIRDISLRVESEKKMQEQEDEIARYKLAKRNELLSQIQKVKNSGGI